MWVVFVSVLFQAKLRLEMELERLRQSQSKEMESKDEEVEEVRQSCQKKVLHRSSPPDLYCCGIQKQASRITITNSIFCVLYAGNTERKLLKMPLLESPSTEVFVEYNIKGNIAHHAWLYQLMPSR